MGLVVARAEIHLPLWVDYADDPQFIRAGEKAELLFIRAACLMKRTLSDGFIHDEQLPRLGLPGVKARADRLVAVGLWDRVEDGYLCPSFLKRNKSRAEVEELSDKRAAAGAKGGRPPKQDAEQTQTKLLDDCKPIDRDKTETEAVPSERDLLFDALVDVFGPATMRSRASHYGKCVTEFLEHDVHPDEVRKRGRLVKDRFDNPSPEALMKWWDALDGVAAKDDAAEPGPLLRERDGQLERFSPGTGWMRAS